MIDYLLKKILSFISKHSRKREPKLNAIGIWFDCCDKSVAPIKNDSLYHKIQKWFTKTYKVNSIEPKLEIHSNIWLAKVTSDVYMEFGLRVQNFKNVDYLNVYLPFHYDEANLKDLFDRLGNTMLLNALFNDNVEIKSNDIGTVRKIKRATGDVISMCALSNYELSHYKSSSENFSGTLLKIKISTIKGLIDDTSDVYFRFRINKTGEIYRTMEENHSFLDGVLKHNGFIDVNFNTKRKLPKCISGEIKNTFKIDRLLLFIMTDGFSNFILQNETPKSTRILESHIWDHYIKWEPNLLSLRPRTERVLAYQWSKKNVDELSIFGKLQYTKKTWLLLGFLILFVLITGMLGSIGGSLILENVRNNTSTGSNESKPNETRSPKESSFKKDSVTKPEKKEVGISSQKEQEKKKDIINDETKNTPPKEASLKKDSITKLEKQGVDISSQKKQEKKKHIINDKTKKAQKGVPQKEGSLEKTL